MREAAQASAAYAQQGVPARSADIGTRTRAERVCAFAQRVIGVVVFALGAAEEFSSVKSSVKTLETRVTELART